MHRFGLTDDQLAAVAGRLKRQRVEGFALHLPIDPPHGGKVAEVVAAAERVRRRG